MAAMNDKPRYRSTVFPSPAQAPGWRPEWPWEWFSPAERRVEVMSDDGRTLLAQWTGRSMTRAGAERKAIARAEAQRTARGRSAR